MSMKFRNYISFYLNGYEVQIEGDQAQWTFARFVREKFLKTGTKIVCEEGDCGACTVLKYNPLEPEQGWLAINSCIMPVFAADACHILTVEALASNSGLHPVQKAMVEKFGSQCGFCTPGIVTAMTALVENSLTNNKTITRKRAQNYLTGNLCRCTGYEPILDAAESIDLRSVEPLSRRYLDSEQIEKLQTWAREPVEIKGQNFSLFMPSEFSQLSLSQQKRLVSGATDMFVVQNKGKEEFKELLSLQKMASLYEISKEAGCIRIGARVSIARARRFFENEDREFSSLLDLFASPQIKNAATLVGNIINASPIADTIPYLLISEAELEIWSPRSNRVVGINNFYQSYKKFDLQSDEVVTHVRIPVGVKPKNAKLYKVSTRKDLDISTVTFAGSLVKEREIIKSAKLCWGGVGPIVERQFDIEKELAGKKFERASFERLLPMIEAKLKPLSDLRGSKEYRMELCKNLFLKFYDDLATECEPSS